MKDPKSHFQEGIGGQGTLPAWGHCREWGLRAGAVVAPGIRAVPKCLSTEA